MESDGAPRTCLGTGAAAIGIAFSTAFLLNLFFGLGFEIPDAMPIVGNLDEAAATALLLACLRYFGIDLLPWFRRGPPGRK